MTHGVRPRDQRTSNGVRAGERLANRWVDIDMSEGVLEVRRRVDAYREDGPPKSAAGVRDIPISSLLVSELRKLRMSSQFSGYGGLVFTTKRGKHVAHDNLIKRSFRPVFASAGIGALNWYGLQHYAVITWIEAALPPNIIQTCAGHSSLHITMDHYGHLIPSDDHRRVMDYLSSGFEF